VDLAMTKVLLESFQTTFWTNDNGLHRSFIIGVMPFHVVPNNYQQEILSTKTLSIDLPYDELSIQPPNRVSNVEILTLEHASSTDECHVVSSLAQMGRYVTDLSTLVHLKLDHTCTITSSVLNQLLNVAPRLTRLTVSSFRNQLRQLFDCTYPQIRWLDMRREYLPGHFRTKFCSVFPSVEHLLNCYLYSEEDLEVLIENLPFLQNLTVHVHSYYFDSDDEFHQWMSEHTHLRNFTFQLIDERQILLWIAR
jgi:hypothetical protein